MKNLFFDCVRRYWNRCLVLLGIAMIKSAKLNFTESLVLKKTEQSHPRHLPVQTPLPITYYLQGWGPVYLFSPQSGIVLHLHEMIHTREHVLSLATERGRNLFSKPPASFCSAPYTWESLPNVDCHQGASAVERRRAPRREVKWPNRYRQSAFDLILYWVF